METDKPVPKTRRDGGILYVSGLPHQYEFWQNRTDHEHVMLVGALGTGKTRSLVVKDMLCHLLNFTATGRGFPAMMVEPTFGLVSDILIPAYEEVIMGEMGVPLHIASKGGRPKIYWPAEFGFGTTMLRSAEVPERLVGPNLSHVGFDEPGLITFDAWKKATVRARHPGAAFRQKFAGGTPEGMGWLSKLFDNPKPGSGYTRIRAVEWHSSMPFYPKQLAGAFAHDPAQLDAYLNALFVPMFSGRCYGAFDPDKHIRESEYDPKLDLWLSCDFNIHHMRWGVYQETPKEIRRLDELAMGQNTDVEATAKEFVRRWGCKAGATQTEFGAIQKHHRTLRITGDSTGGSRSAVGSTCYEELLNEVTPAFRDVSVHVPSAGNPYQRDRVNTVNYHLRGRGRQISIPAESTELIEDLTTNRWCVGRPEISKTHAPPEDQRTHAGDEFGYLLCTIAPVELDTARATIATQAADSEREIESEEHAAVKIKRWLRDRWDAFSFGPKADANAEHVAKACAGSCGGVHAKDDMLRVRIEMEPGDQSEIDYRWFCPDCSRAMGF